MKTLYQLLLDRWNQNCDTVLVTIVEGNGSIPRTTGAYMAVDHTGRIYGTIGGGNLEYQAVKKAMTLTGSDAHLVEDFDLGTGENGGLGMVCGGRVKVLFYSMKGKDPKIAAFLKEALTAATAGKPYWLLLPFSKGYPKIESHLEEGKGHCRILEKYENDKTSGSDKTNRTDKANETNENNEIQKFYAEEFCFDGKVYIFGGGHLAQELVPVLSHLGFWCMVMDDREEYTDPNLFPGVQKTRTVDFTELSLDILKVKKEDYLVVVTRGHRCDMDAERFALRTPASYIGVVGSKRKTQYVREKLLAEGFTDEELDRVHAPIGIDIGSETPAEIAISIAAQLIQARSEKLGLRKKKQMKKQIRKVGMLLVTALSASLLAGCGSKAADKKEAVTITVFAAKSLNQVMGELITEFQKTHENVTIQGSYDSSGTLMTQIEEGASCDVFFSAATKQMNQLDETDGLVVEGTRHNVVNNQVCVVTYKGSNTQVTGLKDIGKASSIALADGSVPVGKYTRQAMVNAGMLESSDDVSKIPTTTISEALGGVEINECANVGAVTAAVAEGSNEVGTVYYSDTYGLEDRLVILEKVSYDLTGDVIYPVAQIENPEADELQASTAKEFVDFLITDDAKEIFQKYYFDTDVEDY